MHAPGDNGDESFVATYDHDGKKAQVTLHFVRKRPVSGGLGTFASGEFRRVAGSQPAELLAALAKALEAKKVEAPKKRVDRLKFDLVILGEKQSRAPSNGVVSGGFVSDPRGDWIVMKAFVAGGEGEFFLNLNPREGVGEFSIKDSDYGDIVVRELAKVL